MSSLDSINMRGGGGGGGGGGVGWGGVGSSDIGEWSYLITRQVTSLSAYPFGWKLCYMYMVDMMIHVPIVMYMYQWVPHLKK